MNALRIGLAALAIAAIGGLENEAEAGNWVVRVEVENVFSGHTYYPGLYQSRYKKAAFAEFDWYERLLKLYPAKFRDDVLDEEGVPWYYMPVRMHIVYVEGIFPTGR